jgi:hypothetical protein
MVLSLPGLVGAFVGLVVGLLNYAAIVAVAERRLRALDRSQSQAEKAEFERKMLLLRRIVLVIDVVTFPLVGYWFGSTIGG